jgi:Uma2 family endonuclease
LVDAVRNWLENATWTEEAYFGLPDSNQIVELSDGKLIIPDMPTLAHQATVLALSFEVERWNRERRAGRVLVAPYPIRLWPGKIREPDVMFFLAEHAARLETQRGGPPDWAAEVLSPSTRRTDLTKKLAEYARAGVREYWILDPDARWVDVFSLVGAQYRRISHSIAGQSAESKLLIGFAVEVASLFSSAPSGEST